MKKKNYKKKFFLFLANKILSAGIISLRREAIPNKLIYFGLVWGEGVPPL